MNERTETGSDRDPAEIERDIDRTRASLGRTVDQLEERLSPGQLLDQALSMARQQGGEFATNLGRSVKNNPIPMLLTGVGLAWLMASSNEPRVRSYAGDGDTMFGDGDSIRSKGDSLASRARSAGTSVGDSMHRAGQSLSETAHRASGAVGSAGARLRGGAYRARSSFEQILEEQPLIIGALGVALGAALGAALPRTEQEDRLMGRASDSLGDRARERAGQAYEEVRSTAGEAADAVRESAREQGAESGWSETEGSRAGAAPWDEESRTGEGRWEEERRPGTEH